jgi:hypothetical protein
MKKLFLSLLAATAVLTPGIAKADIHDDHNELWNTLQDLGVVTLVNHLNHCNDRKKMDGIYYPYSGMLVICQDKMIPGSNKQYKWTENDYNTLRHEAHHVIQDCANGYIADGRTSTMFTDEDLTKFLAMSPSYDKERLAQLRSRLKAKGLHEQTIMEELEAYVVSEDIKAPSITRKLRQFCLGS